MLDGVGKGRGGKIRHKEEVAGLVKRVVKGGKTGEEMEENEMEKNGVVEKKI